MATAFECAQLVKAFYNQSNILPNDWITGITGDIDFNKGFSGKGYSAKSYIKTDSNGAIIDVVFVHKVEEGNFYADIYEEGDLQIYADNLLRDANKFEDIFFRSNPDIPFTITPTHTGLLGGAFIAELAAADSSIEGAKAVTFNNPGTTGISVGNVESGFSSAIYQAFEIIGNTILPQRGTVYQLNTESPTGYHFDIGDLVPLAQPHNLTSLGKEIALATMTLYNVYAKHHASIDTIIKLGFNANGTPNLVSNPEAWPSISSFVIQSFIEDQKEELAAKMAQELAKASSNEIPSAHWEIVLKGLFAAVSSLSQRDMTALETFAKDTAEDFADYLGILLVRSLTHPALPEIATSALLSLVSNILIPDGGIGAVSSVIKGTTGNDIIISGHQADTLVGSGGADIMIGGGGADRFFTFGSETIKDADTLDRVSFFGLREPTGGIKWAPFEDAVALGQNGFAYRVLSGDINDAEGGRLQVQLLGSAYSIVIEHYNRDFATHTGDAGIEIYQEVYGERGADWVKNYVKGLKSAFGNKAVDPLVLDLGAPGFHFRSNTGSNVYFNIEGGSFAHRVGWTREDGFLVRDLNSNNKIDSIAEMFGSASINGFAALKALDSNNDNKITAADAAFASLRVWVDADGDGAIDAGELQLLQNFKNMPAANFAFV